MGSVGNFFAKTAVSAARSLLLGEVKGAAKAFINKKKAKSIGDINNELTDKLGYISAHYTVNAKTQDLVFKSSPVFVHEWLTNSPLVTETIVRDEESGNVFVDNEPVSNAKKLDLINRFIGATGIQAASLASHMDRALGLLTVSDTNAIKFKRHFAGWNPENESVIDGWMNHAFGPILDSDPDYARFLFRKWIVGSARRAINPGVSFDGCLVMQGPAGTGKTLGFRYLLPEPFSGRTGEILANIKQPQRFVESIKGKTIACFDELSVLEHPASEETFKQLLSSQHIDVRMAWAREPRRYALRQGFCATTNKDRFIIDKFLSRRLWTIRLRAGGRLDFDYLFANREALWREAVYLAQTNESCILSVDEQKRVEAENEQHLVI